MKNGALLGLMLALLSACGPWPQVDAPKQAKKDAWPALLPLDDITDQSATSNSSQSEAQRLSSRAAALRARARLMRTSVPDSDAMDALRARLSR